ncbi:MAG: hypothetical protein KME21_13295 [Desmonostoc vinosum HA7617-LM4]|jgi:membrane protein YqaA with SNARE-associated domain|nr:hypothetical protein [Desmonostoc vinosum HA7617-LM4]
MKRQFFNFGDQSALVGALAVVALVLAANVGYFIGRDIGNKTKLPHEQTTQQIYQEQQK